MSKIKKIRRCISCGEVLQVENPQEPGFTTPQALQKHVIVLCEQCFAKQNQGHDVLNEPIFNEDFRVILEKARVTKSLIVYLVDLFSYETSFMSEVAEAIRNNPLIIVANKFDILPEKANEEKILEAVKRRAEDADLHPLEYIVASSTKNYKTEEVLKAINKYRGGRNVYIIGAVGSGKSALVNSLLKIYKNPTNFYITTSIYPNTTLEVIEIPLDSRTAMYDTPGLSISNSMIGYFSDEKEVIRTLVPRERIVPRQIIIGTKEVLVFGGVALLEVVNGIRSSYYCYFSNEVKIHRTTSDRAEGFMKSLIRKQQTKPISKKITSSKDFDLYEINVDYGGNREFVDISIAGLGWISFKDRRQTIRIYVPKGVSIYHGLAKL